MVRQTNDSPSEVCAEGGLVFIDGPFNIAYSMTPEAAVETSDRLLHAAVMAEGQRCEARRVEAEILARHGPLTS